MSDINSSDFASKKDGDCKRTDLILIATAFSVIATLSSCILWRFFGSFDSPLGMLWMFVHVPAMIAYIGTIAEHDPFKGNGFGFFVFIQWAVVGIGLGCMVAAIRSTRRK